MVSVNLGSLYRTDYCSSANFTAQFDFNWNVVMENWDWLTSVCVCVGGGGVSTPQLQTTFTIVQIVAPAFSLIFAQ